MADRLWLILLLLTHLVAPAMPVDSAAASAGSDCRCCVGSAAGCGERAAGCGCAAESEPTDRSHDRTAIPARPVEVAAAFRETVWSVAVAPRGDAPACFSGAARALPVSRVLALLCVWRT